MRFAAQKTIGMQDMLPANGSIYMPNMDNKMGSMMEALKAWEKKRGLSYSFKGKFIENRPKKEVEEKAKEAPKTDRPIVVPRTLGKPGRKRQFTAEEKRQRKNENNRQYRAKNNAEARARSKEWRANLTPEQREQVREKHRQWKARAAERFAAVDNANGNGAARMPLADAAVSGKAR
jgi:hypothetical protein